MAKLLTAPLLATAMLIGGAIPAAAEPDGDYIVVLGEQRAAPRFTGQVEHTFDTVINGFSARMTATEARRLKTDPSVTRVAPDGQVQAFGQQLNPPSWGLDRIDQRALPLDRVYNYPSDAVNVTAYVLDTGVRATHQDFGGRVRGGYDFVDKDTDPSDGNGHGTFVAGVIGGAKYGVAKGATIVPVRVLNDTGAGAKADILAGIDWVAKNAHKPAIANMSFGGLADDTLDAAVRALIASGVSVSVASGASGTDAGQFSPARVVEALTVASSDQLDRAPSNSNHGPLIDLYAPGVGITSAWSTSDTATVTISGTSAASAHVAGGAAVFLARFPTATPAQVARHLVATATIGRLAGVPMDTANRLLYVN
jgi:subtilisin family serine protease